MLTTKANMPGIDKMTCVRQVAVQNATAPPLLLPQQKHQELIFVKAEYCSTLRKPVIMMTYADQIM